MSSGINTPTRVNPQKNPIVVEDVIQAITDLDAKKFRDYFYRARSLFILNGNNKESATKIREQILQTISEGKATEEIAKAFRSYFALTGVELKEIPLITQPDQYPEGIHFVNASTEIIGRPQPSNIEDTINATITLGNEMAQLLFRNYIKRAMNLHGEEKIATFDMLRKHLHSFIQNADNETLNYALDCFPNSKRTTFMRDNPLEINEIEALIARQNGIIFHDSDKDLFKRLMNHVRPITLNALVVLCEEATEKLEGLVRGYVTSALIRKTRLVDGDLHKDKKNELLLNLIESDNDEALATYYHSFGFEVNINTIDLLLAKGFAHTLLEVQEDNKLTKGQFDILFGLATGTNETPCLNIDQWKAVLDAHVKEGLGFELSDKQYELIRDLRPSLITYIDEAAHAPARTPPALGSSGNAGLLLP